MTGFGKATGEINQKKITVEIKSLNSKQADITVRMPSFYKEKELEVRSYINQQLNRGKIEFNLYAELLGDQSSYQINPEVYKKYYRDLESIANDLGSDKSQLMATVAKLPDVLKTEREELDENEWNHINSIVKEAVAALDEFRTDEGKSLGEELSLRINNILNLLNGVEDFEGDRLATIKERINGHLKETVGEENINRDRFEQELIYYIEKYDITEEKTRLTTHCHYFMETMSSQESEGKKLGFIAQEIGREINTLGAKANNADLQKIVVQMKDELEKIKEQTLNIL